MRRTILFQKMTQLVHGDINEHNIVWRVKNSKNHKLVLIDWDEALREKPCFRKSETPEEKLRYPSALVDFPESYTKQQLLHLFDHLFHKYYKFEDMTAPSKTKTSSNNHIHVDWKEYQTIQANCRSQIKDQGMVIAVESQFQGLYRFIERTTTSPEG
jgi:hypothetical protein